MDEDSAIGQMLHEELGVFKDLGFIWPRYDRKMKLYTIVYFLTLSFFTVSGYTSFLFLLDDLHTFFLNVNYMLLIHLALSLPYLWKRSRTEQISMFLMVIEGLSRYAIELPPAVSQAIRQRVKKELYMFIIVLVATTISGGCVVFSPNIDTYFGDIQNKTSDYITYNLPVHVWAPFKLHQSFWGRLVLLFSLIIAVILIILTILTSELLFVRFCQKIFYEQEILIWSLKNIMKRAQKALESLHVNSNSSLDFWVDFCLIENIKHHQRIKRFAVLYNKIVSPMLMSAWCLGTTTIALSLYEAGQGNVSFGKLLASGSLTIAEVLNVFVLSRMGQHFVNLEEEIYNQVCFLPWNKFSVSTRRNLLTFLSNTHHPDVIKAGSVIPMNYDSFATAMNTAYSYFNLLKASKLN